MVNWDARRSLDDIIIWPLSSISSYTPLSLSSTKGESKGPLRNTRSVESTCCRPIRRRRRDKTSGHQLLFFPPKKKKKKGLDGIFIKAGSSFHRRASAHTSQLVHFFVYIVGGPGQGITSLFSRPAIICFLLGTAQTCSSPLCSITGLQFLLG